MTTRGSVRPGRPRSAQAHQAILDAAVARRSRLGRLYGQRVIGPRRAASAELAIDLLVGGLLLRRLTGRLGRADPTPERAVDILLAGLAR